MLSTLLALLIQQDLAAKNQDTWQPMYALTADAEPVEIKKIIKPELKAKAVFALDLDSGKILYSHNADQKLPIASLNKLMTAWIILKDSDLADIVTVNPESTKIEPAKANLLANEKITVKSLLQALLIKSANDAALALAYHHSGSVEKFAQAMNQNARELGIFNSHFVNPTGFDEPDQYSTARDIAHLARLIYLKPLIRETAIIKELTIQSIDGKFNHELKTTNDLLESYLQVFGLKTGTTDLAGQCLITVIKNPNGNRIMTVILNSPDRFQETKILAQWLFNSYSWQ